MAEVATDTAAVIVNVERGLRRIGEMIAERDVLMDPITDCLRPRPAGLSRAEELPRYIGELVDFAVAAGQQERQDVVGQILNARLQRIRRLKVGMAAVFD